MKTFIKSSPLKQRALYEAAVGRIAELEAAAAKPVKKKAAPKKAAAKKAKK